jgi:hypothetical protein
VIEQPTSWVSPDYHVLRIDIPIENYAADTTIDLETDPAAFRAVLYWLDAKGPFDPTIENAQIRAVSHTGTITFDEVADPCQGTSCAMAKGTIDITFLMLRADIDPAMFN